MQYIYSLIVIKKKKGILLVNLLVVVNSVMHGLYIDWYWAQLNYITQRSYKVNNLFVIPICSLFTHEHWEESFKNDFKMVTKFGTKKKIFF